MLSWFRRQHPSTVAAWLLAVAALIGMADALFLTLEYIDALKNPGAVTPCSVSSFVNCTKTVQGPYGHYVPGVPNPLWGMLWYAGLLCYGVLRGYGAEISRRGRSFVGILLLLGIVFSYRLYLASIFELRGVCPFCLVSTTVSTLAFLAFVVDDSHYRDAVITGIWQKIVASFQTFSFLIFVVGLPVFIGWGLRWTPDRLSVITHWSFPVMTITVLAMGAIHLWAWRALRRR